MIRQDLTIRQGETWSYTHTKLSGGSAVDLTGYSARASIRDGQAGSLKAYLSSGSDADGGTITLGGVAGTITLSMTADESDALLSTSDLEALLAGVEYNAVAEFIYDLEIEDASGNVTRELQGRVFVHRSATT